MQNLLFPVPAPCWLRVFSWSPVFCVSWYGAFICWMGWKPSWSQLGSSSLGKFFFFYSSLPDSFFFLSFSHILSYLTFWENSSTLSLKISTEFAISAVMYFITYNFLGLWIFIMVSCSSFWGYHITGFLLFAVSDSSMPLMFYYFGSSTCWLFWVVCWPSAVCF